jgi:hypothetical protein
MVLFFYHEKNPITTAPFASHNVMSKPSIMLALVCLAVVHRLRPAWICIALDAAARSEKVNPQRLSRLCTKCLGVFENSLASATRIGRPVHEKKNESDTAQIALLGALLDVTTYILKHVSLRKPAIRALIVGAFLRLKQAHPELTRRRFCQTLNLSGRTFRHWVANQGKNEQQRLKPVAPPPKKKSRRPSVPRADRDSAFSSFCRAPNSPPTPPTSVPAVSR